jgi:uncharacterized protein (TIGR03435 family)
MKLAGIILIGFACGSAHAQTADGQPSFDAASIKPAPPPTGRGMRVMTNGGPGSKDPGLYTCDNCSLTQLVTQAYDIKGYQLSAPSWLETERFIVTAKIPDKATKEQFRLMLQNLLAERFKLAIHREKKEAQVYELVVAKGGPKLKESVEEVPKDGDNAPDDPSPLPPLGGRGRGPNLDKDGYPVVPKGCSGCMMIMNGKARLHSEKENMKDFADTLSYQVGKPVIDATGLKGKYDIDLSFDASGMMRGGGGQPPGGGPPPAEANTPLGATDGDLGVPIVGAIQSQLGLKLEAKKGQVETIVVDHIEKVPTEN